MTGLWHRQDGSLTGPGGGEAGARVRASAVNRVRVLYHFGTLERSLNFFKSNYPPGTLVQL